MKSSSLPGQLGRSRTVWLDRLAAFRRRSSSTLSALPLSPAEPAHRRPRGIIQLPGGKRDLRAAPPELRGHREHGRWSHHVPHREGRGRGICPGTPPALRTHRSRSSLRSLLRPRGTSRASWTRAARALTGPSRRDVDDSRIRAALSLAGPAVGVLGARMPLAHPARACRPNSEGAALRAESVPAAASALEAERAGSAHDSQGCLGRGSPATVTPAQRRALAVAEVFRPG